LLRKDVCLAGAGLVVARTDGLVVGWHLDPSEISWPSPGAHRSLAESGANPEQPLRVGWVSEQVWD